MVLQPWSSANSRHGHFSLVLRGGAHGRLPRARRHRSAVSLCALVACQYHCLGGAQGRAWVFPCPVPMLAAGQLRPASVLVRHLPGKRVSLFLRLRLAGRLFGSLCVLLYPIWCVAVPRCCLCCCCSTQQRSLLRSPLERVPVQFSAPTWLMRMLQLGEQVRACAVAATVVLHLCVCRC